MADQGLLEEAQEAILRRIVKESVASRVKQLAEAYAWLRGSHEEDRSAPSQR